MKTIRIHLLLFMSLLLLSGITAFPVKTEISLLYYYQDHFPDFLSNWIVRLFFELNETPDVMFYGTDWLAFAHSVISLFFIPVYQKPQQYKANITAGMAACGLVFPLAFICGPLRGIPFFHQLIDCSFGLFGFLYLLYILKKINQLKES